MVFIIKKVSKVDIENIAIIQAVADIEAVIQPQDAWSYPVIYDLLAQDFIQLYIAMDSIHNQLVCYGLIQVVFEQAEILRIGTHPDYQRQGIASQLFAKLNEELVENKVDSLLLEVRADNSPAIALYKQQGFIVIHKRKGYYHFPNQVAIDALIMQRQYNDKS